MTKSWKQVNAIYQIYPRSFMDSNGDGIGDLRGVIEKLGYIKGSEASLGIDAIWFSPIFPSPMADFGYDVSNYKDIDSVFGTLDDFKELIRLAHDQDIKVMVDFVPNHSSHLHPWFIESKSSKDNAKHDFYVWRDGKPDGSPPNNWLSIFGGSAWEFDESRGQYYLHTFLKEQPDLNWDNPTVRKEMCDVVRFWLGLGVDGIRADAVRWMSKDPSFKDDPINPKFDNKSKDLFDSVIHKYSRFGKKLFDYLKELTDVVAEFDDRIMIFEDYPDSNYGTKEQYMGFYGVNPAVSMPFNFEGLWVPYDADSYQRFITEFQGMLEHGVHTPVYCFSNHDNSRIVTRHGTEQARLLALLQMTLPGIPVIYYGDEIGMKDGVIPQHMIQDPVELRKPGLGQGRDPERTPMQWNTESNAGFSTHAPWLPIGENVSTINVATQFSEADSYLSLYRRLLSLRSKYDVLRLGDYETFGDHNKYVMKFARRLEDQHVYVLFNFSDTEQKESLPHPGRVLCCTHPVDYPDVTDEGVILLRPHEAVLIECAKHPLE